MDSDINAGPSGVEPETAGFLSPEIKVGISTWLNTGPVHTYIHHKFNAIHI